MTEKPISSLSKHILIVFGLVMFAALVSFAASTVYTTDLSERAVWTERQAEAVHTAVHSMSAFIDEAQSVLDFVSLLEEDYLRTAPDVLDRIIKQHPELLELAYYDQNGFNLANAQSDPDMLKNLPAIFQSNWFLTASTGRVWMGELLLSPDNEPYLIIAAPMDDSGGVAARLRLGTLWQMIENFRFGERGIAFVVDREGRVIAHPDRDVVLERSMHHVGAQAVSQEPDVETPIGAYLDLNGEPVIGMMMPIPDTAWAVVTELPSSELYQRASGMLLLLGAQTVLFTATAIFIVRRAIQREVLTPLNLLRQGAERVGSGDLTHRTPVWRPDEIGLLADAFNAMTASLQQREAQIDANSAALAEEAEERQRTEKALDRSLDEKQAIVDAIPDAIFRVSRSGVLLSCKSSPELQTVTDPDALIGKHLASVLPPDLSRRSLDAVEQTLNTSQAQIFEYDFELGGSTHIFEVRMVVGHLHEVIAIVRDITTQKRREQQLERELETEKQLVEMKSRFAVLMSHEFRTPLAIISNANYLIRKFAQRLDDEQREGYYQTIQSQIQQLASLLDDILLISQGELVSGQITLRKMAINDFCRDIVREFEGVPTHTVIFQNSLTGAQKVWIDSSMMKRALTGLLSNALKYSPEGSTVRVVLACEDKETIIRIEDEGIGIAAEDIPFLFDPFYRGDNISNRKGIGMGLAVVNQIIRTHGGTIEVESEQGRGSVFTIRLPTEDGQ